MRMMIAVISSRVSNWQQSSRKMNNKKSRKHWKKRKGMKIRKFKIPKKSKLIDDWLPFLIYV